VEDSIQMNGEEWRYTHTDEHSALLGHIRSSHFKTWEQLKDTLHAKYRLPKNVYKDSHSNTLSYPLLGYDKNIEWDGASECVARIVGVHKWEVVESRYAGGAERFFKVDKRAPMVVIEGCRSKHLTAWVEGSQSVPASNVPAATFNEPDLHDLIPTDTEPLPYWFGKALGAHNVGSTAAPSVVAKVAATPAAAKPAASKALAPITAKPAVTAVAPRSLPPLVAGASVAAAAAVVAKPAALPAPTATPAPAISAVAAIKTPATPPPQSAAATTPAPLMKPLAKLPMATISVSVKPSGTPPPNNKEALIAERVKLEQEIAAKQRRLEEITKLLGQ